MHFFASSCSTIFLVIIKFRYHRQQENRLVQDGVDSILYIAQFVPIKSCYVSGPN